MDSQHADTQSSVILFVINNYFIACYHSNISMVISLVGNLDFWHPYLPNDLMSQLFVFWYVYLVEGLKIGFSEVGLAKLTLDNDNDDLVNGEHSRGIFLPSYLVCGNYIRLSDTLWVRTWSISIQIMSWCMVIFMDALLSILFYSNFTCFHDVAPKLKWK